MKNLPVYSHAGNQRHWTVRRCLKNTERTNIFFIVPYLKLLSDLSAHRSTVRRLDAREMFLDALFGELYNEHEEALIRALVKSL